MTSAQPLHETGVTKNVKIIFRLLSAVAMLAAASITAGMTTAQAGTTEQPKPYVTPSQHTAPPAFATVPTTDPRPQTASAADECAAARARAAKGTKYACVEYGPPKLDAQPGVGLKTIQPIPDWCKNYSGQWIGYRDHVCRVRSVTLNISTDGVIVGTIMFNEFAQAVTSSTYLTWQQQIQLGVYSMEGDTAGTQVGGYGRCTGVCVDVSQDFPLAPVGYGLYPGGEAFFKGTTTNRGDMGNALGDFDVTFYNPSWAGGRSNTGHMEFPPVRCDFAVPGNNVVPGCVFWQWGGIMSYSLTGPYSELATHLRDAQASGLPGAYGGSAPLHRLVNADAQKKNYETSCPDAYTRPAGKSCDEYPFKTTYEGAWTGQGTGRTFSWCSIPQLPTGITGPSGYSACMINADHNSQGGSQLNSFYVDQRILDGDPLYVWIYA